MIIPEEEWKRLEDKENKWKAIIPTVKQILSDFELKTKIRVVGSRRTWARGDRLIQFGYMHVPGRIFLEYKGQLARWKWPFGPGLTKGKIVACTIVEEIAHALNYKNGGGGRHGRGFLRHFIKVWNHVNENDELIKKCESVFG